MWCDYNIIYRLAEGPGVARGKKKLKIVHLKFGDGDGPNLCTVKNVDVSSTFIENIFRSGLTFVSSSDILTIKFDNKKC